MQKETAHGLELRMNAITCPPGGSPAGASASPAMSYRGNESDDKFKQRSAEARCRGSPPLGHAVPQPLAQLRPAPGHACVVACSERVARRLPSTSWPVRIGPRGLQVDRPSWPRPSLPSAVSEVARLAAKRPAPTVLGFRHASAVREVPWRPSQHRCHHHGSPLIDNRVRR